MCFLVWLQYSRETERKEEENIPEALHFARSGSGLRRLRFLAEGLDEAEKVHQMRRLLRRQRAPFCGHPWQRWLADAQPDEKIPEHLILFVDALSDPGPQSRQMDGLGWRCLAERRCPWNTAGVLHVDAGVVNTVGSAPPWPGRPPWCCQSSKAPSKRNPAGQSPSPPPQRRGTVRWWMRPRW